LGVELPLEHGDALADLAGGDLRVARDHELADVEQGAPDDGNLDRAAVPYRVELGPGVEIDHGVAGVAVVPAQPVDHGDEGPTREDAADLDVDHRGELGLAPQRLDVLAGG